MALLKPKVPFWIFPWACWNPYFCSVWWLCMGTKKDHFPKTDSCNKNARYRYCLPSEQIVFAYFLKNAIWTKRPFSFTTTPKTLFFWAFFEISLFHFFHLFSFAFTNIKETKNKNALLFVKPLFDTSATCKKIYFRAPTHYLYSFKIPKNTKKLGKTSKNILDRFSTQPWTDVRLQKGQILDRFSTLQHISPRSPFLDHKAFIGGWGGGVYISNSAAGALYPPSIHPPPLEGHFQEWRGGGV